MEESGGEHDAGWYGGVFVTTNAAGTAVTLGPGTPQLGGSWTYSTTWNNLVNWLAGR